MHAYANVILLIKSTIIFSYKLRSFSYNKKLTDFVNLGNQGQKDDSTKKLTDFVNLVTRDRKMTVPESCHIVLTFVIGVNKLTYELIAQEL